MLSSSWQNYPSRPRSATDAQQSDEHVVAFQQSQMTVWPGGPPFPPPNLTRSVRNVDEIIPRLYISDLAFAENPTLLSSYRITHILSTLPEAIFRPPPSLLPDQPIRMQIKLEDFPFAELVAHLPKTTSFIREALSSNQDAHVLVHCVEGVSRSVSVVAAFLVAEYGWSPNHAVEFIKSKRGVANPNFGFIQQLQEYSTQLYANVGLHLPPLSAPM